MGEDQVRLAMQRPITIMVLVSAIILVAIFAITKMKIDIFPDLKVPRVSVIQPYGGMDPAQMEGFIVSFYEQHFLYISGIDHIESKSIQSAAVLDVYFQPSMNMADAMSQVLAQVERSRAYMPPGTVTPFVIRFDVGSVPVGYLVMDSPTRSVGEIQDLAYVRVRPKVSTLPGVSMPPPFGGNQRSIVISVNAEKLKEYHLGPEDIVSTLAKGNPIMPSGIVRTGDLQRMSTINSVVSDIQELGNLPLTMGSGPAVYLKDIGRIQDTIDIPTGYALVNGRQTVYLAISKTADASTLSVVDEVKAAIPEIKNVLPKDISVKYVLDQSIYVSEAISGVLFEGLTGAGLTGLMVLIFLQDIPSALVVILNIPVAILSAVVCLWISGQTVNIMTLGGLSLAVGILVDEATVAIENIHTHLGKGERLYLAVWEALLEVVTPRLLAMLSVISVFAPSFFMSGSTQALFVPLSLAVGFAMISSYILSNTFVPVLSCWLLKHAEHKEDDGENVSHQGLHEGEEHGGFMGKIQSLYKNVVHFNYKIRWPILLVYLTCVPALIFILFPSLPTEIFPSGNPSAFQLRLRAPTGLRIERTLDITEKVLDIINEEAGGKNNVEVSVSYVGTQPPSYAISNAYMWTSGPQESVIIVGLKEKANIIMHDLQNKLRARLANEFPKCSFTFEAGDIINKIMNFGAPTPIQVDVNGPSFPRDTQYARALLEKMKAISYLKDVTIVQPLDYPTLVVDVDRIRAGQLGVDLTALGHAFVSSTYSSRFVTPVYWRDANSGMSYQVQVQIPQNEITSINDVESTPAKTGHYEGPFIRDVANTHYGTMVGEYDRYNMARMVSITANIAGNDLGFASREVDKAIKTLGTPPRGVKVNVRGQVPIMNNTFISLGFGVLFAVVSIFLLLVGYFQSVRLAIIVLSVTPAILCGALIALKLTGSSINIQSFMGTIMSIGIGVANSILVVDFSEVRRLDGMSAQDAALGGAVSRLRPVMMTSIAMIAGMVPMALGLGEGGDRNAPLGRAVIGGLVFSTSTVFMVVPLIFGIVQRKTSRNKPTMHPDDVYS